MKKITIEVPDEKYYQISQILVLMDLKIIDNDKENNQYCLNSSETEALMFQASVKEKMKYKNPIPPPSIISKENEDIVNECQCKNKRKLRDI